MTLSHSAIQSICCIYYMDHILYIKPNIKLQIILNSNRPFFHNFENPQWTAGGYIVSYKKTFLVVKSKKLNCSWVINPVHFLTFTLDLSSSTEYKNYYSWSQVQIPSPNHPNHIYALYKAYITQWLLFKRWKMFKDW